MTKSHNLMPCVERRGALRGCLTAQAHAAIKGDYVTMDGIGLHAHGLEALVCSAPIATPRIALDAGSVPSAGRRWPWPVRRVDLRMSRGKSSAVAAARP